MTHSTAELSPTEWVRDQTEQILRTGTTDGVTVQNRPVVLITMTGAKTGKQRLVPLMRVEHDGRYAIVASKGGAPEHPTWYGNVVANPTVTVQDGTTVGTFVAAYPPYTEYQQKTARQIPVLVLEPTA